MCNFMLFRINCMFSGISKDKSVILCFVTCFENNRCELFSFCYYLKLRNCYFDVIRKVDVKFQRFLGFIYIEWYLQLFLSFWKIHWYTHTHKIKIKYNMYLSRNIFLFNEVFMQESGSGLKVLGSEFTFKL